MLMHSFISALAHHEEASARGSLHLGEFAGGHAARASLSRGAPDDDFPEGFGLLKLGLGVAGQFEARNQGA